VEHIPVLAGTLAEKIHLPPNGAMVDATIGHGGHTLMFGKRLGPRGIIIGLDVDEKALRTARSRLAGLECRVILVRSNFSRLAEQLHEHRIESVDFILADLGVCSAQLADQELGLSFQANMPLDMRIDKRLKTTAADIVNEADEKSLAEIIYRFGQDRASRRIARFIVRHRADEPITTTGQLAAIVCRALARPGRKQRRTKHLNSAPSLLRPNGWIAVISYHSLEDRLVKDSFKQNEKDNVYRIITRKPIVPTKQEIDRNRRARSAKLRIARRV